MDPRIDHANAEPFAIWIYTELPPAPTDPDSQSWGDGHPFEEVAPREGWLCIERGAGDECHAALAGYEVHRTSRGSLSYVVGPEGTSGEHGHAVFCVRDDTAVELPVGVSPREWFELEDDDEDDNEWCADDEDGEGEEDRPRMA